MPFRSETESLREQLRRVEEQANDLVDERTALEQQLAAQERAGRGLRRKPLVLAACVAVIGASAAVGFTAGDLAADKRTRDARELRERRETGALGEVSHEARECKQLEYARQGELILCQQERASARPYASDLQSSPTRRNPVPTRMGVPR